MKRQINIKRLFLQLLRALDYRYFGFSEELLLALL